MQQLFRLEKNKKKKATHLIKCDYSCAVEIINKKNKLPLNIPRLTNFYK